MSRVKNFLIEYETKLVLVAGFILIALISFQFGYLEGKKHAGKAVVIEKTVEVAKNESTSIPTVAGVNALESAEKITDTKKIPPDCVYVGSKSSNKVHLPNCRYAKSIKPENLVCFKSLDDALKQGRVADKNCIK